MKRILAFMLVAIMLVAYSGFTFTVNAEDSTNCTISISSDVGAAFVGDLVNVYFSYTSITGYGLTGGSFDIHYDIAKLRPVTHTTGANIGDVVVNTVSSPGNVWVSDDWTNRSATGLGAGYITIMFSDEGSGSNEGFSEAATADTVVPKCSIQFEVIDSGSTASESADIGITGSDLCDSRMLGVTASYSTFSLKILKSITSSNVNVKFESPFVPIVGSAQARPRTSIAANYKQLDYICIPAKKNPKDVITWFDGYAEGAIKCVKADKSTALSLVSTRVYVGTGCWIQLVNSNGDVVSEKEVMVVGDATGDGQVNMLDYKKARVAAISSTDNVDARIFNTYFAAADLVGAAVYRTYLAMDDYKVIRVAVIAGVSPVRSGWPA